MSNKTMVTTTRLDEETYAILLRIAKDESVHPDTLASQLLSAAVLDQVMEEPGEWE